MKINNALYPIFFLTKLNSLAMLGFPDFLNPADIINIHIRKKLLHTTLTGKATMKTRAYNPRT